jgi:hypothetical protein
MGKLIQKQMSCGSHIIYISLIDNTGSVTITDNGLYPDSDSRSHRRDLNFNTITVPLMTRDNLKELYTTIGEVLEKNKID